MREGKLHVNHPLLITADDVGKLLGVSKRTLRRMINDGRIIRPIKLGGLLRWNFEKVKEWVAKGCPESGTSGESDLNRQEAR